MKNEEYQKIIKHIKDLKTIQNAQKKRGLNNANTLTVVLDAHDERRLHSRFIKFLLNPRGKHFQDDLFLQSFLDEIDLKKFDEIDLKTFVDTKNCTVYTEYKNIDIYITDGTRHIILENKIWAGDQPGQIARYIKTIEDENEGVNPENIAIVYLSPWGKHPDKDSLDDKNGKELNIENDFLVCKNSGNEYPYRKISYKCHILLWLQSIHKEIQNIINLSVMITQYKETVEQILGQHKEKVMSFTDYIEEQSNKKELVNIIEEMIPEYEKYKKTIMAKFWCKVKQAIENSSEFNKEWTCYFHNKDRLISGEKAGHSPFRVFQGDFDDKKPYFGIEYGTNDYKNLWG